MLKKTIIQKETFLFFLIIGVSLLIYLFNITYSDVWTDESFTKEIIKHPFPRMMKLLSDDFHPPLYFIGLKLFTYLTGINDFTIRLFSVVGAICTLIISYTAGQRIFGKKGALYYCSLLMALPMLASYSQNARMYTWAAFSITGVFLYSCLFIKTNKKSDLILLALFSLIAAYLHNYGLIAAFWSNLFVFLYLLSRKNKAWLAHLVTGLSVLVLYLPWFLILLSQVKSAKDDFWIPKLTFDTILSCYRSPFAPKFWIPKITILMIVVIYGLTLISFYKNLIKRKGDNRLALVISLIIFNFTILTAVVISVILKPILYFRYTMTVVTMLMVPPALCFMSFRNKLLKSILLILIFCLGIYTSIISSYFSFGPYKQSSEYLFKTHPDIKKIVHITEVTAGPLLDHNEIGSWNHYWLENENTVSYTNMNVFDELNTIRKLDDVLDRDEVFCLVNIENGPLNTENVDLVLSQSNLIQLDKVTDNKNKNGMVILYYILQYQGESTPPE